MKKRRIHSRRKHFANKIGQAPETPVYIGDAAHLPKPKITKMAYNAKELVECELTAEALAKFKPDAGKKLWLNIHGVHDADLVRQICERFKLHPLVLEDILNTEQRPKLDAFDDYLFVETNFFYYDKTEQTISAEQVSMVLGKQFVLTFQERSTGIFEPIRERLRAEKGQMRTLGCDYLAYAVLDAVVDSYFGVLDAMADDCEALEDTLLSRPSNKELHDLHQLKRASIELRRSVWPLREVINHLTRNETDFVAPQTLPYMRDVYDHTVHFIESLEAQRDMLAGMMDIYLSSVSQRVNLELRALTVVAMLFMPATLIAGIFGMNTKWLPWQSETDGFWFVIALMAGIGVLMGIIFWRRQWINRNTFSLRKGED